jgi:hypothetical protein
MTNRELVSVRPLLIDNDTHEILAKGAWYDITKDPEDERENEAMADHQVFELYRDAAQGACWVLDFCQD